MRRRHLHPAARGSALVSTLLVVVVLTIIVIAFLQSMTVERATAKSYLNRYRAELAASAAQTEATTLLSDLMLRFPYHGIGYLQRPDGSGGNIPVVPVLYGSSNALTTPPTAHFLVSGTTADATVLNIDPEDDRSVAVNVQEDSDPGWMGSPVDTAGNPIYRECRAPWVYLLQDPTAPYQPDPDAAGYNPRVARFAWWVEDETSKIDLLQAGNTEGSSGGFGAPRQENLSIPNDRTYQDAVARKPENVDVGAVPIKFGAPLNSTDSASNQSLVNFMRTMVDKPKDVRLLNQVPGFSAATPSDSSETIARFYTTMASVSNELAGNGRRRVNINALVTNNLDSPDIIAGDLDDIAYAITGKHIFESPKGFFGNESDSHPDALMPDFGQRLWPSSENSGLGFSLSPKEKETIYLTKIAANIRDYIDADSNPTFVDPEGNVIAGSNKPSFAADLPIGTFPNINHASPMPRAIGQEAIPYLEKESFTVKFANGAVSVFEAFGFFNPSTKDFIAPEGTFLRCFDRLRWRTGGFGDFAMPSYVLNLSGLKFPAGAMTVISTGSASDSASEPPAPMLDRSKVAWRPTAGTMTPAGATTFNGGASSYTPNPRNGTYDLSTKVVWGNNHGYYGGFPAVTLTSFTTGSTNYTMSANNTYRYRGNSLRGNDSRGSTGDPRSLNEPLFMNRNTSGNAEDQARFWDDSTIRLHEAKNTSYVDPSAWPDWTREFSGTAETTYAVIRDQPMTSIGELGNIYDPYRRREQGSINYVRGGGRTLRVGQPDDVTADARNGIKGTDTNVVADLNKAAALPRFTKAWQNSAWRLTDIFDVRFDASLARTGEVDTQTRLIPPQAAGKVNINSVLRDEGAALRALLRGFRFLSGNAESGAPYTDPDLSNRVLSDAEIEKIVAAVRRYLEQNGPIVERGELSQLVDDAGKPLFSAAESTLGSQNMKQVHDRGREEIFRRLIGMLTTRSNSFTVFAIGQAIRERRDGSGAYVPVVQSTSKQAVTYRFDPVIAGLTGNAIPDTNPSAKPTQFLARPLYVHP